MKLPSLLIPDPTIVRFAVRLTVKEYQATGEWCKLVYQCIESISYQRVGDLVVVKEKLEVDGEVVLSDVDAEDETISRLVGPFYC